MQTLWPCLPGFVNRKTSCFLWMKVMAKLQWQTEEMVRRQLEVRTIFSCFQKRSIWPQIKNINIKSFLGSFAAGESSRTLDRLQNSPASPWQGKQVVVVGFLSTQLKEVLSFVWINWKQAILVRIINITSACADTRLPMAGNCLNLFGRDWYAMTLVVLTLVNS